MSKNLNIPYTAENTMKEIAGRPKAQEVYDKETLERGIVTDVAGWHHFVGVIKSTELKRTHWLSIRKASHCLYGRRRGSIGARFFGYSIRLRLFNVDLI